MNNALLVIDVQLGMLAIPETQPHDGQAVIARIGGLMERARRTGTPIFFVQHDGGAGHQLAAGSRGFLFVPELKPRPDDDVTVKRECNAFRATDLEAKLRKAGIRHLVICGMQTEYCIDTAVHAAFDRNFTVTLVSDAHTTVDTPVLKAKDIIAHHNQTLDTFATVAPAADIRFL